MKPIVLQRHVQKNSNDVKTFGEINPNDLVDVIQHLANGTIPTEDASDPNSEWWILKTKLLSFATKLENADAQAKDAIAKAINENTPSHWPFSGYIDWTRKEVQDAMKNIDNVLYYSTIESKNKLDKTKAAWIALLAQQNITSKLVSAPSSSVAASAATSAVASAGTSSATAPAPAPAPAGAETPKTDQKPTETQKSDKHTPSEDREASSSSRWYQSPYVVGGGVVVLLGVGYLVYTKMK